MMDTRDGVSHTCPAARVRVFNVPDMYEEVQNAMSLFASNARRAS